MNTAKKLLIFELVISLFLCSGILATATSPGKTTGVAGFVNNTTFPPVVNPLEPENEIVIEEGGTAGPLNIDYVPNLNFGNSRKIMNYDGIYYASSLTVTKVDQEDGEIQTPEEVPNFIQITDNRGTGTGWKLSVSATEFKTSAEKGSKILKGAVITFYNPQVYTPNSLSDAPVASNQVVIAAEEESTPSTVLEAEEGGGKATWGVYYAGTEDADTGEESVTLEVPGRTAKLAETYTATLTWNLVEAPY